MVSVTRAAVVPSCVTETGHSSRPGYRGRADWRLQGRNLVGEVRTLLEEHVAKLVAVGDADQLALHFQEQQIKGHCKEAAKCAIAVSIVRTFEAAFPLQAIHVWVNTATVEVAVGYNNPSWVDHPFANFINKFDRGHYPELVA